MYCRQQNYSLLTTNSSLLTHSFLMDQYTDLFQSQRALLRAGSPAAMDAPREAAFADFARLGFPSRRVERYRYTDTAAMFAPDYGLNLQRLDIPANPYDAFRCDVPNLSTLLYFVVNDTLYGKAMPKAALPEGVVVDSLSHFALARPDIFAKHYAQIAPTADDAICALNTMLAQDGLAVYIPRGVQMDQTIQIVNILRADVPLMVNRRVLIVLEEGAKAQLLFCDHAADDRDFLSTQVIEVSVGECASLELYCMEETHSKCRRTSNLVVRQAGGSSFAHNMITLQGGQTRNRADVHLDGPGAECRLNGMVIADGQQHVDNNTLIVHHTHHCTSNQLYKYVLDGHATGAFAGRVLVEHGAQQTASQMTNRNLVATADARMFTQPMLEIYADDVKCAHGSTVGQLNDAALFYMRQRGISVDEARQLLQRAFLGEVIDTMQLPPLRDRLHHLVEKRFRGELAKCDGCRLCK